MLYANSSGSFSELSKALYDFGADEGSLEIFAQFMDMSKPCDITLLKDVKRMNLFGSINYQYTQQLSKALKHELLRPNDDEAIYRYVNFIYALGGSMCWRLFSDSAEIANEKAEIYIYRGFKDKFDEAHKPYAKAASYGITVARASMSSNFYNMPKKEDVDTCLMALSTVDKECISAKCLLIIYALDQLEAGDERAKTAIDILNDVISYASAVTLDKTKSTYITLALCEAACFDKTMQGRLEMFISKRDIRESYMTIVGSTRELKLDFKRIYAMIESKPSLVVPDYILWFKYKEDMQRVAKSYTQVYIEAIKKCENTRRAKELEDVILELDAGYKKEDADIKGKARKRITDELCDCFPKRDVIREFLDGARTLDDAMGAIKDGKLVYNNKRGALCYYPVFGRDEFISRAITVCMTCDAAYGRTYRIDEHTGFDIGVADNISAAFEMMLECGASLTLALESVAVCVEDVYSAQDKCIEAAVNLLEAKKDMLKEVDTKKLGASARTYYAQAIGRHANEFKAEVIALTDDGSKAVKSVIAEILSKHKNWADDIKELLAAKKAAKRELALDVIAKQGADDYQAELKAAFEAEKSDKIKQKIAALLGVETEGEKPAVQLSDEQSIHKLAKSSRTSKYAFLFEREFKPVHTKDGKEAEEDVLRALVMSYTSFATPSRSKLADDIAAKLDEKELEAFAAEIFGRWYDNGAQAKQKSILYFCAVHGGIPMVRDYMHYIKDWAENMRGAIAAEAVRAMALGGSSEALMNIDNMSRKFKNKQVRGAAGESLANAAEQLGITTQELADRIVPDLGFDEQLCREFDYGTRQFKVYITPSLELECFSGEKKIKTLPKPGANDDADKANAALAEFKEMKKQLKNVVSAQRQRLEYVLMCDRKWSSSGWQELFVKNAVMHCFAIGLIWGIYEDGKLKETFRYMDDGSFTTADGDELDIPENAQIGLVHPIELDAETIALWKEQLEDYEITQPFEQLGRKVFLPTNEELEQNKITRFKDVSLNSITLVNKMTKLGWYKGQAEDAGFFYYFYREDIAARTKKPDGSIITDGFGVMLTFSGASVVIYDFEGEETETENLIFYKAGTSPDYYDKKETGYLKISEVSPRYFSEIIMQLSAVLKTELPEGDGAGGGDV